MKEQKLVVLEEEPPGQSSSRTEEESDPGGRCLSSIEDLIANAEVMSDSSRKFLETYFPTTTVAEWNDWKWQVRNSITKISELERFVSLTDAERNSETMLSLRITPYYLSLAIENEAIRKCVIPSSDTLSSSENESEDPLNEDHQMPVQGLVHRYPDRVLFLATDFCSSNCQYCTRSRMVGCHEQTADWDKALDYISKHTEIRDVLISGGDPLTMSDEKLDMLLSKITSIKHIEIVRIGTKVPVVLPKRITLNLVEVLKKYYPLYINVHFTHPDELTLETRQACERLADAGIPLGSQTVLLKDVNDDREVLRKLFTGLLKIRVKPYYIYSCDRVLGSSHFVVEVTKGIELIRGLRGFITGFAVPQYIIDAPNGGGKVSISPINYSIEDEKVIVTNYLGKQYEYFDRG